MGMITPDPMTRCPKCKAMYCPGYWRKGYCVTDMHFCGEPTADGDQVASVVRYWYERNRESWWDRHKFTGAEPDRSGAHADEFILRLIGEIGRVQAERQRQVDARAYRDRGVYKGDKHDWMV